MPKGKQQPPEERFWLYVLKGPDCWEWQGSRHGPAGYGYFKAWPDRSPVRAHRFIWELLNGPIPDGFEVMHKCDNPPCVRPDHLKLGTSLNNCQDKIAKGRARYVAPPRKLTPEQELAICRLSDGPRVLGRKYGVAHTTIMNIRRRHMSNV